MKSLILFICLNTCWSSIWSGNSVNNKRIASREARIHCDSLVVDIYDVVIEQEASAFCRHASSSITFFECGNDLKKIQSKYEGDRETLLSTYDLTNKNRIKVEKRLLVYSPPKWSDSSVLTSDESFLYQFEEGILVKSSNPSVDKEVLQSQLLEEIKQYQDIFMNRP